MPKLRYSEFYQDIDVDVFEAAIGFVPVEQDRGNDRGHCLFPENHSHGDTTGKFAIHREKRVYNCWVCGGGSFLSLAMELYGFDVDEATTWLKQFALTDTRSDAEFRDYLLEMLADVEKRVETMPYFNERVLERFDGPVDYFRSRGISDEIIYKYHLCYSNNLLKASPMKRDADEQLYKIDDDYYGPAAIFPHYWDGRLVGWQHRWMEWTEDKANVPRWLAKYTNTTDFPKDTTLFNFDAAMQATRPIVVLESVPSVLYLQSFDIPAVSYFGSTLGESQLRLLRRFNQGVILAPDNDNVGSKLVGTGTKYLERFIPVWVADKVDLGPKADLGDYHNNGGYAALREHLTERIQRPI